MASVLGGSKKPTQVPPHLQHTSRNCNCRLLSSAEFDNIHLSVTLRRPLQTLLAASRRVFAFPLTHTEEGLTTARLAPQLEQQHPRGKTRCQRYKVERVQPVASSGQTEKDNADGAPVGQPHPLWQSAHADGYLVFVAEGDDAHGKQGNAESNTVVKTQTEGDSAGGPVLVVFGEVSKRSVGTVRGDNKLGKRRGGEDVRHDERDVDILPKDGWWAY